MHRCDFIKCNKRVLCPPCFSRGYLNVRTCNQQRGKYTFFSLSSLLSIFKYVTSDIWVEHERHLIESSFPTCTWVWAPAQPGKSIQVGRCGGSYSMEWEGLPNRSVPWAFGQMVAPMNRSFRVRQLGPSESLLRLNWLRGRSKLIYTGWLGRIRAF